MARAIHFKELNCYQNPKNQIIVVDGPPGTGKSYAIAAIVYLANQMNKSVVITSHKKQALDVIDNMLTERFKKLHPRSKPAVLRLERPGGPATLNSMENTLSTQVINGARNRAYDINRDAVAADRTSLFNQIDQDNKHFWEDTTQYKDMVQKAFALAQEEEALFGGVSVEPIRLPAGTLMPVDRIRTSTLAFARALRNYSESLNVHFRSFPEIISYSNEYFYKESQIELVPNRIRTKPIGEVLRFLKVETKGNSGRRVNLDEIEAIKNDIENVITQGYKGTIGVICSFQDQKDRMEEIFRKEMKIHPDLVRNHRFTVWFVGDVQGEERDMIYYSFVEDKKLDNGSLRDIYPVIGGAADNPRRLKMQRLNVGFSRAKDTMVFVHSMPLTDYSDTRLGNALLHYEKMLNTAHDQYVADESVFGSPAEKELYRLLLQTKFFQTHRDSLRLIAQFEIGKYIREEYHRYIPNYRVDFLLTKSQGGKEKSLVLEYDGVEFHTRNPEIVTRHNFDQEYLEYDIERQLELESYGYSFLRINKYSLIPDKQGRSQADVLNDLLENIFE